MNKIEIDLNAISYNLTKIRKILYPETKIIGDVSSNAYGHGLVETARVVWTAGAETLLVSDLEEAIALRMSKIKCPIIVDGFVDPKHYRKIIDFDLTLTVSDYEPAFYLSREAKKQNLWASIDVKVDTGENALGIKSHEFINVYQKFNDLDHIKIFSISSEFADPSDKAYSNEQAKNLQSLLFTLQQMGLPFPLIYMADVDELAIDLEFQFGAVKTGTALYGISNYADLDLNAALELKSQITLFSRVPKGAYVGKGRKFKAQNPKNIAIIPVGYLHGYDSRLAGKADILIAGRRAKVVGSIESDYLLADVTGIKADMLDDIVLIGKSGNDMVSTEEIAQKAEISAKEFLCRMSPKITREYRFK